MARLILVIWIACLGTLLLGQAVLDQSNALPVDPSVRIGRLANGLTYYIKVNKQPPNRATLQLAMKFGSVQEEDDQQGYAHLTEHMAFRGSKHYPGAGLINYLNSIGVGLHNCLGAATTIDMINYELQLPTDSLEVISNGILILRDWAKNLDFDETSLMAERDVVLEEMRRERGAEDRIRRQLLGLVYSGSRYADRLPIGKQGVLEAVTSEKIREFYRDWYRPDLQAVIAVGDFDPEFVERQIKEKFSDLAIAPNSPEYIVYKVPDRSEPEAIIITDPEAPPSALQLIWNRDRPELEMVGDYRQNMILGMIGQMAENRLQELTNQADPPFISVKSQGFVNIRGKANASFYSQIQPDKAIPAMTALATEIERIKRHGFTPTELNRAKQVSLSRAEKAVAESETQNSKLLAWKCFGSFCLGNPIMDADQNAELTRSLLSEISLEDVNDMAGILYPDNNLVVALIAPEGEKDILPDKDRLLEVLNKVRQQDIVLYETSVVDSVLIRNEIDPGRIVSENFHPGSGIREWKLSNSVIVLSKKTTFKNDEVLIQAIRTGGTDQYPLSDLHAASVAAEYVKENGVGGMSPAILSKKLTGKYVSVTPYIDDGEEGFVATSSRLDLETAFQLLHLYASSPNLNQRDFASWLIKAQTRLQKDTADPVKCLIDSLSSLLYGRQPRSRPMQADDLEQLSLDRIGVIYRDRFTALEDFVFIVVGSFDEKDLKAHCEKYLASLPATRGNEKLKNPGLRFEKGKRTIKLYRGLEEKSLVVMSVFGECDYSLTTQSELDMLTLLLNQKLRENIRDARSGAYLIQAENEITPRPVPSYRIDIAMQCAPDRVEELSGVITATLDSLSAGLIDDKYLNMLGTTLRMKEETNLRDNQWWLDRIVWAFRSKQPVKNLPIEKPIVVKPDPKQFRKVARRYLLHNKNLVSGILYPISRYETESNADQ